MARTTRALKECAEWLHFCLAIGWPKSDLDRLAELWWEYHDDYGRLKGTAGDGQRHTSLVVLPAWFESTPATNAISARITMTDNDVDQPATVGDYACNFCDWKSTDTSRPLSRGTKVGCPACEREARFVGSHPIVFKTTKEAMEYAARNRIPTVVPVDVAQPAGAGVERIYMSQTCSGYSHERETVHDIEYIRADLTCTPADVQERARRAVQLLDDAGYLDEQFIADMAHNVGSDKQEFFEVCKQKMADIIAREFGGEVGHNDA